MADTVGAKHVAAGWELRLPKGKVVVLDEEDAWKVGRDLWAKRVHLDPRLRAGAGPSVLEVLQDQLDQLTDAYGVREAVGPQTVEEGQLRGAIYGLAWAIAAMRVPYTENRQADALEEERRSRTRVRS